MYWARSSRASSSTFWELEKRTDTPSGGALVTPGRGLSLGVAGALEGSISAFSRGGRTSLCICIVGNINS